MYRKGAIRIEEKDKVYEEFNKRFEEDIVPIWNDQETINQLKIAAFYNYIIGTWEEFISRLEGNQ